MSIRQLLWGLVPAFLAAMLVTTVLVAVILLQGGTAITDLNIFGVDVGAAANLVEVLNLAAFFFLPLLFALLVALQVGFARLRRLFWPQVGTDPVPANRRDGLLEGLNGQKEFVERNTSWPEHMARARPAASAGAVHFGDARFSTPVLDQRAIRKFLGRARLRGSVQGMRDNVLIVTGEPGAGKSVLTQEVHASLVGGLSAKRQYLIPLIVFASDLTLEALGTSEANAPRLKDFLASYFRGRGDQGNIELAKFIELLWVQHDFLVIVDGLDEIAQRSAYVPIQRQLRHMIARELRDESQRVRRFILSCRTEDDMAIFPEARSVELRGLRTESARRRFCENMISGNSLSLAQRAFLRRALDRNSRSLSSVDIFRRNPYFLALLLDYFRERLPQSARVIDFNQLIQSYIAREIERPQALISPTAPAPSQNREELRRSLERCAGVFLQYLAFHMTTSAGEEALYGHSEVSAELVSGFVAALDQPSAGAAEGAWPQVAALLDQLAQGRPLTDGEMSQHLVQGHLDENDLRILGSLAQQPELDAKAMMLGAFSIIALERRVDEPEWYQQLAGQLAAVSAGHLGDPRRRLAIALLARGLAAAHVLRLINVDLEDGAATARFKHRRLAEYYAACYFRDRWSELEHLGASPWLTPVLNLVAAIEGERCLAMRWFLDRVTDTAADAAPNWRKKVTDAAEVAAFAHRGDTYQGLLRDMAETFLRRLEQVRSDARPAKADKAKRDLVTELTIINALDFLGDLDVPEIAIEPKLRTKFQSQQIAEPPHLNLYTAKAGNALRQLTATPNPSEFQMAVFANTARDPITVLGQPAKAFRYGIGAQWAFCLVYVLLVEIALCGTAWYLVDWGVAASQGTEAMLVRQIAGGLAAGAVAAIRIQNWIRNPTRAAWVSAAPLHLVLAIVYLVYFFALVIVGLVQRLPDWVRRIAYYAPKALKWLAWLVHPGIALLTTKIVRGLPAALRFLVRVAPALFGTALLGVLGYGAFALYVYLIPPTPDQSAANTPVATASAPVAEPADPEAIAAKEASARAVALCEHAQAARTKMLELKRASDSATDLARARSEISKIAEGLARTSPPWNCVQEGPSYENQSVSEGILEDLLDKDPMLIPLPAGRPPEFGSADFERLRGLVADKPDVPARETLFSGLSALAGLIRVQVHETRLDNEISRLTKARASGRITDRMDQAYPTQEGYPAFARSTATLLNQAEALSTELPRIRAVLQEQIQRAFIRWAVALSLLGLFSWLLRNEIARRRDARIFARVRKEPLVALCEALKRSDLSDRLRERLRVVLASSDVQRADIALVEDVVQVLDARKNARDLKFAVDLGGTVTDLVNRLER